MRKTIAFSSALCALILAAPAWAGGNDESCPPGDWFCDDAGAAAPPAKAGPDKASTKVVAPKGASVEKVEGEGGTTVIVNTDPPPRRRHRPHRRKPRRYDYPRPHRRHHRRRHRHTKWGFNMRLQTAMMGSDERADKSGDAGMGGLGFSLRVRPTRVFALDFGLDFLGGTDYSGRKRSEMPFSINTMLFVNPRSKVQLYFLAGVNWSSADVQVVENNNTRTAEWSYFGLQSGVGLEFRISRKVALNVDMIGFIRGRTDDEAETQPEFTDPQTGRTTNASGGGLFRGGLTFYW